VFGVDSNSDVRLSHADFFSFLLFTTERAGSSRGDAMTVVTLEADVLLK
jgi:hypothetical protein